MLMKGLSLLTSTNLRRAMVGTNKYYIFHDLNSDIIIIKDAQKNSSSFYNKKQKQQNLLQYKINKAATSKLLGKE